MRKQAKNIISLSKMLLKEILVYFEHFPWIAESESDIGHPPSKFLGIYT